ncbi:MAG: hypothetical protein Q4A28_09310 [Brachymonas sp.]|nr:hypothetical protein [Brachymonas sp.]
MKKIACSLMLALATLPAWADAGDAARIAWLEARVAELEKRLLVLEQKSSQNIVIEHRRGSKPVFVCQASAFGKTYEVAEGNEGLARLKVRKACLADHDEMFCRDSRMKCQRFD